MKKVLTLCFVALFLASCFKSDESPKENLSPYKDGEEITLKGVDDTSVTLVRKNKGFVIKNDENKIIMFDIFGTFCAPCQAEAPNLTALQIKNKNKIKIIALSYYEDVSKEYIKKEFIEKYSGYYFIVDSTQTTRLVTQIIADINYQEMIQLPFKVALKDGVYEYLTNVWEGHKQTKFYLGAISTDVIKEDLGLR